MELKVVKVSIIIPTYNVEDYIEECLDSLICQSMTSYEIICVDDASTDNTYKVLNTYSNLYSNITVVRNLKNKGAAVSRNNGLEMAKGEYVIFLDSDDYYHPQLLEKMYDAVQEHQADVAVCNVNYYDFQGNVIRQHGWNKALIKTNIITLNDDKTNIFSGMLSAPWNKLVRKDYLVENGIYFQNLKNSNDVYYSMMTLACAEKIVLVPDILVHYRYERSGNITQNKKEKKDFLISAYEQVIKVLKEKGLWSGAIYIDGIRTMIRRCYGLVTMSNGDICQYYHSEWIDRIVPLMSAEDVKKLGDTWSYYQYLYLNKQISYCENLYQLLAEEILEWLKQFDKTKIALWGAGRLAQEFMGAVPDAKQSVSYVVDNDVTKQGNYLCGIKICAFENVKDEVNKYIVLNESIVEEIKRQVGDDRKIVNMKQIMDTFTFKVAD